MHRKFRMLLANVQRHRFETAKQLSAELLTEVVMEHPAMPD